MSSDAHINPNPRPDAGMDDDRLPTASVDVPRFKAPGAESFPHQIDNYRITRRLGAGGMGVVFEAEQQNPRRLVALKIINSGMASREAMRRFQHEAQVLGRLAHIGIAQIYEAGMFDHGAGGRPFFAMELVRGKTINEFANTNHLGSNQRLDLLAKVCDAVQHAHLKGVIHRDLKPGNILVCADGQPKVLDFGVARATDCDVRATTLQTRADQLIGTLPYMSPEQALGDPNELDVRSDVYALGVIGYELLTGRLPYEVDQRTVFEAVRVIREEEPTSLSSIDRSLRGDVETIISKALEKDRSRRYQSAADLAADVRRYLTDEPIVARPASMSYRMRKFARRHKTMVAGVAAVAVALMAGVVASTTFAVREKHARLLAQDEAEKARKATARALRESEQVKLARAETQTQADRARNEADKANAISNFHRTMLSRANPAFAQGRNVTVREVLEQAAREIGAQFPSQPQLEATIRTTIAESYQALSEYRQATDQFERAAQLFRQTLGDRDPETLTAEANLAVAYHDLGRMEESVALSRSVLQRRGEMLGENHSSTIASRVNLASALADVGANDEAEDLYRHAIGQATEALGEGDRTTLTAMGGLAVLLKREGKYDEAAELFQRTIAVSQKSLGQDDVNTLADIDNYAGLLHLQGRFEESQTMLEDLLERHVRVYGPTHAATLIIKNNLAISLQNNGRLAKAQEMFRSVVNDGRERFGEGHPDVLVAMSNLAGLLHQRGEMHEAEQLLNETVDAQLRTLGETHAETIGTMGTLAIVLSDQDKNDAAAQWYRRALAATGKVNGPEHPQTLNAQSEFAAFLRDTGEYEEAERLFKQTLEALRRTRGDQAEQTIVVIYQYAGLLQKVERWQESLALSEEIMRTAEVLPAGHPFRMLTPMRYGISMSGLGRYEEAEQSFHEALRRLEAVEGSSPLWRRYVMEAMVRMYDNWHKPDDAATWRKRIEELATPRGEA